MAGVRAALASRKVHPRMTTIVFFISEDWYFLSHRLALAEACRDAGWTVVVATRVGAAGDRIARAGLKLEPIPLDRGGMNPLRDLRATLALFGVLRRHRPDILHAVGLKPVLYGTIAAALAGTPHIVSALAGLGSILSGAARRAGPIRTLVLAALRPLLNRSRVRVVVQNDDDRALVLANRFAVAGRIVTIRGSGVDLAAFPALPEPASSPVVFALVARMLIDKGVPEAVEALRMLRARGIDATLRLVGAPDPDNPMSLDETRLRASAALPGVIWNGASGDIVGVWRDSHVALLPSWREGMPKSLLEALACARPVITTDTTGCRDVIEDGVEGFLVPLKNPAALAAAMERLAGDADLRARMGAAARHRAEARFDRRQVVAAHMALYRSLIAGSGSAGSGSGSANR
jgi:glycosyltransferase involved in cell wall biosynthesis